MCNIYVLVTVMFQRFVSCTVNAQISARALINFSKFYGGRLLERGAYFQTFRP